MGTNNFELDAMAEKMNIKNYKKACMKDELIGMKAEENECGIINLNDSTVSTEENKAYGHWVAFFKKNGKSYYFCSYGSPPPIEVIDYLGKPILTHNKAIQPFGSSICGDLCILFLHFMNHDLKYTDVIIDMQEMFQD